MAEPEFPLAGLECLIHEPTRLPVMTALSASNGADFLFLQRITGLTHGNLPSHLSKLEDAGLVTVKKRFVGKKPNTFASLTDKGREDMNEHWTRLGNPRNGPADESPETSTEG